MTLADQTAIGSGLSMAQVHEILAHAQDYPWRMHDGIGLLGLRLDDQRRYRLHVWAPREDQGQPPIHDHPYDFVSTVIVGAMTNTRYEESPSGVEFTRIRYLASDEQMQTTDSVRLAATSQTWREGEQYAQSAHELHDSRQEPGTVTLIRCSFRDVTELTVCLRAGDEFVSGLARAATAQEVQRITETALAWF